MRPPRASSYSAPKLSASASEAVLRQTVTDSFGIVNTNDDESYDEAVRLAANVCGTPAALLSFTDHGRQWLTARVGIEPRECPGALAFCAQAVRAPEHVTVVPDVAEDPRFARSKGKAANMPFRFYAGAPLVAPLGTPFGTLSVMDRTTRRITDSQTTALRTLARQIVRQLALGQENTALRLANARLSEISMTDVLTCIANRRAFNDRLATEEAHSRQTGDPFSMLLMDIDHFKLFNDHHGHLAGDEALFRIADTLKRNNRSYDLLARYGGEEFALILPRTRLDAAVATAERLRRAVETAQMPWQNMTLSIGAATFEPVFGSMGLIAAADRALYAAKAAGRNRVAMADVHDNQAISFLT